MTDSLQPFRSTRAIINTQALKDNLSKVREYAPQSRVMAVIKANAYGHGLVAVAKSLETVDSFAVASVDEALQLRKNSIHTPIVVLGGFNDGMELQAAYQYHLTPVINNSSQLQVLSDFVATRVGLLSNKLSVWLKVDTGMHRLGFPLHEIESAYLKVKALTAIDPKIGLMSHFACADERHNNFNSRQLELFAEVVNKLQPSLTSMANSAAIINMPDSHYDIVRAGIMIYGVNPFPEQSGVDLGLKPVMTLKANIVAIKELAKGEKIGYGSTWECPQDMQMAIVAIGYGDGYPRHAVSGTPVLLNGVETQLIGRVSMDMISIDLRPLMNQGISVKVGNEVILWGDNLAIERVASCADTIAYELLCGVTARVNLEYS